LGSSKNPHVYSYTLRLFSSPGLALRPLVTVLKVVYILKNPRHPL